MVLTPDPIVVTTTIVAPTVVNPTSLTPVAVSTITSVVVPTIVLSACTLTPDSVTASTVVTEPDVKTGEILYPDAITGTSSVVLPVVRKSGVTLTPEVISSNAIIVSVTLLNGTFFTPDFVRAITSVEAPTLTVSGVVTITPDVISSTTLVLIPTFVVGGSIIIPPDVVDVPVTVIEPSIILGLRIEPPVVVATTTVTPPNLVIGSVVYPLHPSGRKQITVDQQQGGEKYPFVEPSDDLDQILGDLYLNYDDAGCEFTAPFSVKWLRGFGTEVATDPIGGGHQFDMEIVDSDGTSIFKSTEADLFTTTPWGDNDGVFAVVAEWVKSSTGEILRAVVYTAWESEELARDWPIYFEPENGVLDPRTLERIPPHVTQFAIINDLDDPNADDLVDMGENVIFEGGYNAEFSHLLDLETGTNTDGAAYVRPIQLDLEPGLGLGRYPCDPEVLLKLINSVTPDEQGNIIVDGTGCYRVERPLENVEDNEADVVKATLKIANDCGPCCNCEDFVAVYNAIKRLDRIYRDFGIRAEAIRDQYLANTQRWNTAASTECRSQGPTLQVLAEAFPDCKVAFGIGVCNTTDAPLQNVRVKFDFDYGPGDPNYIEPTDPEAPIITAENSLQGCIVCNSTTRKGNVNPNTGGGKYTRPYKIEGAWPDFTMGFDCINPGDTGIITWVMHFPNCSDSDVIEYVTIFNGKATKGSVSLLDEADDDCCEGFVDSSYNSEILSDSSESSEEP
jgi:hypothetical protein